MLDILLVPYSGYAKKLLVHASVGMHGVPENLKGSGLCQELRTVGCCGLTGWVPGKGFKD